VSDYILSHTIPQEDQRLALMSQILDPQLRFRLLQLDVAVGWRCLEVGAGNGSISAWLAERVGETGRVVSTDIEPSFLERLEAPNLEVRRLDVTRDELEPAAFDLVCGRALLLHLPERISVVARLAEAVKPGGLIVFEEPDFSPAAAVESPLWREVWEGFVAWAEQKGIDYFVGRRLPRRLQELGFEDVTAHGETLLFNGGSTGAQYYWLTIEELRDDLVGSGFLSTAQLEGFRSLLENPAFWAMNISFVTTSGRRPA
jgi:SAM-dependent methyltransferase